MDMMHTIVSAQWLSARLRDPATIVLDATLPPVGANAPTSARDIYDRYLQAHLPGASFFDIDELSDHSTSLPHMLPTAESFARSMSALGISEESNIVVYEQAGVFSGPRAWWMLRAMGARRVCLLDGGLEAWREAGLPIESGRVERPACTFRATFDPGAVVSFSDLRQRLVRREQVLDARSAARFAGTAPEPRPGIRSGHMPNAISLPFAELLADGRLKTPDALRQLFSAKGIDLEQPITTTCGSGVTAAVLALGLERAGATQVTLYDGSWAEYAQHPEATIEIND